MLDSPLDHVRVGIIVPRHGQTAVRRNLLKRRLRELVRTMLIPLNASKDILIRCRRTAYECSFDELKLQLTSVQTELMGERD